ncbi:putative Dol-P-Glc:Glc(2)Man(9)GlcNAc(2)-PP-Dol alpha-1,2-glucosyltransferase [Lethenteron reissneri]|uniref:putative Dol-P-Glc:Glc(2)Man(9)GlcNAc(2)-PP-Dol alpha-1,2-glucosyltransferase n=1 Tax=Lethenteron reissneri TaxID=7753 RepID=UPI002AB7235F|nr:putative Dol-P-Glc:Glc(2)Man(9)GlcNAc(2)-PP-Dol alpha-1,2-glucosyltransferase [Lethenteron reissneri]
MAALCVATAAAAYLGISAAIFSAMSGSQPEPYMDEIFHVPQAQKYCNGSFLEWDPKITTPPGLYAFSLGLLSPLGWMLGLPPSERCSPTLLRLTSLLFSLGNFYTLYLLTCRLHSDTKLSTPHQLLQALSLALLPVLYFFSFLYYTDAGSTFLALLAYLMCAHGRHGAAALVSLLALCFRQTNVVWVAFYAGTVVCQELDKAWEEQHSKKDASPSDRRSPSLWQSWLQLLRFGLQWLRSPESMWRALAPAWPYALPLGAFLAFVVANDGIVLGDRASHQACLHFPQLFYFLVFTLAFSSHLLLSPTRLRDSALALRRHPVAALALTALGCLLVWRFTYVHPYLLADNRHYTFYLWRRALGRQALARFLPVPAYLFAGWVLSEALRAKSPFWRAGFAVCVMAATVPQRLLELRYFILPYLVLRLNAPVPPVPHLLVEAALHLAVNLATVHLFLHRTFQWPDSADLQRFMW